MNILVADDDDVSRSLLSAALSVGGHEVTAVERGDEALRLALADEFRMLVLDWHMPGMDGVDVCRRVRQAELSGYVYVILLTAGSKSGDAVKALEAGADDFVHKPFDPAELQARVRAGERVISLETREMTIFAMAKLAESRDPETGAHLERVRSYCKVLGQHLADQGALKVENPREYVRQLYLTSPLHDIGKVGIPDCVLLKPGRLNDREYAIMKTHTTLGAETLDAATRSYPGTTFLEMARDIALTHHERWDGSGYPYGISGENIPLSGRITAVADVYDALTSARVYKAAMTHDVAKAMIQKDAGTHFDPALVQAFLACEDRFIETRERYREVLAEAA